LKCENYEEGYCLKKNVPCVFENREWGCDIYRHNFNNKEMVRKGNEDLKQLEKILKRDNVLHL